MTPRNLILILCALILFGVYLCFFTDWFAPSDIQVIHTIRPNTAGGRRFRGRDLPRVSSHLVSFSINRRLALTAVKVIPASDIATNKYPHPIWHLVSDSNSVPTKAVIYGLPIRGMRPAVRGAWADQLEPNTAYKLFLESREGKVAHDFKTPPGFPPPK